MPKKQDSAPPASTIIVITGAVLLSVAIAASLVLVMRHLGSVSLPGCGPASACAQATSSVWGTLPIIDLPTAHLGLAYFLAMLVAWLVARGALPPALRWIARLGLLGSIALTVIMIIGGYLCPYCVAVHIANIAFVVVMEMTSRGALVPGRTPGISFTAVLLVAVATLWIVDAQHEARIAEIAEAEREESTQEIIGSSAGRAEERERAGSPGESQAREGLGFDESEVEPFTGRYRLGPEAAPIRIVIFSDYQCPDCRRIEQEVQQILAARDDVSFSAKHFPFDEKCNRLARERSFSPHPNACWAARAAETAGIFEGADGFWRMHEWLFDQKGSFTDASLPPALTALGFDARTFITAMMSDQSLDPVLEDIEEAITLGIRQTPMIFINGVEFRGWLTPGGLTRTVQEIAATNPPPLTPAHDRPLGALERYVADWRAQPRRLLPSDPQDWSTGPEDADARIVIWGDYQEPFTAEVDRRIRAAIADLPAVRYSFRHYPFDQSCNPYVETTKHPQACRASQAAEAAGRLGGVDAYWRMHEWLIENQTSFNDERLREAAIEMNIDPEALLREMDSPEVTEAIRRDAGGAKAATTAVFGASRGVGVPLIFVNDKHVPSWRLEGEPVLERIIAEARSAPGDP